MTLYNHQQEYFRKLEKEREEVFMTCLRTMVDPPINGEITKKKLDAAGVTMVTKQKDRGYETWLEQKGKRISPVFSISFKLDLPIKPY